MTSPDVLEQAPAFFPAPGSLVAEMFGIADEAHTVSRILDVADFCGWQSDGKGGRFELWTLRKKLGHHPVGTTIARPTLLKAIKDYGRTFIDERSLDDFAAVESPTKGGALP